MVHGQTAQQLHLLSRGMTVHKRKAQQMKAVFPMLFHGTLATWFAHRHTVQIKLVKAKYVGESESAIIDTVNAVSTY